MATRYALHVFDHASCPSSFSVGRGSFSAVCLQLHGYANTACVELELEEYENDIDAFMTIEKSIDPTSYPDAL
jgi:hypothetical protein